MGGVEVEVGWDAGERGGGNHRQEGQFILCKEAQNMQIKVQKNVVVLCGFFFFVVVFFGGCFCCFAFLRRKCRTEYNFEGKSSFFKRQALI